MKVLSLMLPAFAALSLATPLKASNNKYLYDREKLDNGALLLSEIDRQLPRVDFYLCLTIGSASDPRGKRGLTNLMAEMLLRGSQARSRMALAEDLSTLGSTAEVVVHHDWLAIEGDSLSRNLLATLDLVSEAFLQPVFDAQELEKLKEETIAYLRLQRDDDYGAARLFFRRFLYGDHPYGHEPEGWQPEISTITVKDLRDHHQRHVVTGNFYFALAGDIDGTALRSLYKQFFTNLPVGPRTTVKVPPPRDPEGKHLLLINRTDREQVQILLGRPGVSGTNPDRSAFTLATHALGGYFTSLMSREIRTKRGWSYNAFSQLGTCSGRSDFMMAAFPEQKNSLKCLSLMQRLYQRFVSEGLSKQDYQAAKGHLINRLPFQKETADQRLSIRLTESLWGLPPGFFFESHKRLSRITSGQARQVVRRYLNDSDLITVVYGTSTELVQQLADQGDFGQIHQTNYQVALPPAWSD